MSDLYVSTYGYEEMGLRWAIVDPRNTKQAIFCTKTLEEAVRKERGYHYLGKKYKRVIMAIQPENVEKRR